MARPRPWMGRWRRPAAAVVLLCGLTQPAGWALLRTVGTATPQSVDALRKLRCTPYVAAASPRCTTDSTARRFRSGSSRSLCRRRVDSSDDNTNARILTGDARVAVIVPGLLYGSDSMEQLAADMTSAGYPAVVAPLNWWHWLPCLGGRSMRPILERIDYAVDTALQRGGSAPLPEPEYTFCDLMSDFLENPGGVAKVGGSSDPDEYPVVEPRGRDFGAQGRAMRGSSRGAAGRVALVGHSAGGWIARIFLSRSAYGGHAYNGADRVHSLVTLGSPHAPASGVAYSSIRWLARQNESTVPIDEAAAVGGDSAVHRRVRCLTVGSGGTLANFSDFTRNAYRFCGADPRDDSTDGDGVTTLASAQALEGGTSLTLRGAAHAPSYPAIGPTARLAQRVSEGQPWYGSPEMLSRWLPWLMEDK